MQPDRGVRWLGVTLSLGLAAQPVIAAPQISFGHVQYDAGVVFEGAPVVHLYPFTNHGDRPLRVLSSDTIPKLVEWGYTNVYFFREGLPAWVSEDFPVE